MNSIKMVFIFSLFILFSCTKELKKYDGINSIYFVASIDPTTNGVTDKTEMSFGLSSPSQVDSIIGIPVRVLGVPSGADREYRFRVIDSSTAKKGKDYDFVNTKFIMKAGAVTDTIKIKLYRTAILTDTALSIALKLEANENFATKMDSLSDNTATGQKLSYISHTVYVSDVLRKPRYWSPSSFGDYSKKKLLLICQLMNITPLYLEISTPTLQSEIVYFGKFVQNYLNDRKAKGDIIYEDDGAEMVMGYRSL